MGETEVNLLDCVTVEPRSDVPSIEVSPDAPSAKANAIEASGKTIAVIITTEPAPFEARFARRLGSDIYVESRMEDVFKLLPTIACTRVYADFRQLDEAFRGKRWSGQSVLRHLGSQPATRHIQVFIMATTWQSPQESWLVGRMGAAGMVARRPEAIALSLMAAPIEEPGRHPRIAPAERSIEQTLLIEAATTTSATLPVDVDVDVVTVDGGAWKHAVDERLKRFAGGIGARVIRTQVTQTLVDTGRITREQYARSLAEGLGDPTRRAAFLSSLAHIDR